VQGVKAPLREPQTLLIRRFLASAYEGILTGKEEGVRVVVSVFGVYLVTLGMYLVTPLKLFGWKCCFNELSPGSYVRRSRSLRALRVLCQDCLVKQAWSTLLPAPTFKNGLALCEGTLRNNDSQQNK
jgi:hypothetical protein